MEIPGFEIEKEVASGAMGIVYRARQSGMNRTVAIKTIHPHLAKDEKFVRRFIREAQAAGSIASPNICTVYAVGEHKEVHWMAMEWLPDTLEDRLDRAKKIPPKRALQWVRDVATGLRPAHQNGLVHRDLKPSNIVFRGDEAVVTDFGIVLDPTANRLTQTGAVVGTPYYMSPEQVQFPDIDHRSDIYSLGAMLYELMTGSVPYPRDSADLVRLAHITEPFPHLPCDLEPYNALVQRMTQKDPAKRPQDCLQLIEEIDAVLEPTGASTVEAPATTGPIDWDKLKMSEAEEAAPKRQRLDRTFWALSLAVMVGTTFVIYRLVEGPENPVRIETPTPGPVTHPTKELDAEGGRTSSNVARMEDALASHVGANGFIDDAWALKLIRQTAMAGDPVAEGWIARCQYLGCMKVPVDQEAATTSISTLVPTLEVLAVEGDAQARHLLAFAVGKGLGAEQNTTGSATLLELACGTGFAIACRELGVMFDEGGGMEQDFDRAWALYDRACEGGDLYGCSYVAPGLYASSLHGAVVPGEEEGNFDRARRLFERVCDGGLAIGCTALGDFYRDGVAVEGDYAHAARLYRQACAAGDPGGCASLAYSYHSGDGVPRDDVLAVEFWQQACTSDSPASDGLSAGFPRKTVPAPGMAGGQSTLVVPVLSFQRPRGVACTYLGIAHRDGKGVARDLSKANEYFRLGCQAGNADSCGLLDQPLSRLRPTPPAS